MARSQNRHRIPRSVDQDDPQDRGIAASSTIRSIDPQSEEGRRIVAQVLHDESLREARGEKTKAKRGRRPNYWSNLLDRERSQRWRDEQLERENDTPLEAEAD